MREDYVRNVILIDVPGGEDALAYRTLDGRMLAEYVFDAARKSRAVDAIVMTADPGHAALCESAFSVPVAEGGPYGGYGYIKEHYGCEKLVVLSALCPMVTSAQIDEYFGLLDSFRSVGTMGPDGVMPPFAARFSDWPLKGAPQYVSGDWPDSMAIGTVDDIRAFGEKYAEKVTAPQREKTLGVVDYYLSADGFPEIRKWISDCRDYMEVLREKYALTSYTLNFQTEGNIVYEAKSEKLGEIIIKFTPSERRFRKEWVYYRNAADGVMAGMPDYDTERHIMVLDKIRPGFQVRFSDDNPELRKLYDLVSDNMIPFEKTGCSAEEVPSVTGEFEEYRKFAYDAPYEQEFRHSMEEKAYKVWDAYFKDQPVYYLHRDLHRRNILKTRDGVVAIDPMGAAGPKAFEYVIAYIIELREYPDDLNDELFERMNAYFSKYVPREELLAAMFYFWVFKMNDYCFQKNDGYKLASWCRKCLLKVYFDGVDDPADENVMPKGLAKL